MDKIYDPDHYRVVFFSSAPIGVPFLEQLANDKRFEVVGVVTQPDKPSWRWMEMNECIIKKEAKKIFHKENFIFTPTKLNPEKSEEGKEFANRLAEKNPDYIVVIAYGKIIPQAILDIPKIAPINVHGSLLPKYRWASPIQTCLLNDDKETWITIMKMDAWLDTGAMIDKRWFHIPFDRTAKDIIAKMQDFWPAFLSDTLRKYGKKMLGEVKQDDTLATSCSKIEKESWMIDPWKDPIHDVYRKYRAFCLRPKIYFMLEGKRVIIEELKLDEFAYNSNEQAPVFQQDKQLNPAVENILLKPEGKKPMTWQEFSNGYLK
jgi:methionyl-tRNA formyltransferase